MGNIIGALIMDALINSHNTFNINFSGIVRRIAIYRFGA